MLCYLKPLGSTPRIKKKVGGGEERRKEGRKKPSERQLIDVFEDVDETPKFSSLLVKFGNPHRDGYILEIQQCSSKQRGL